MLDGDTDSGRRPRAGRKVFLSRVLDVVASDSVDRGAEQCFILVEVAVVLSVERKSRGLQASRAQ